MSLTESTMLELGTQAPDFSLPDVVSGQRVSPKTFADKKALLVMFICQHCPYVQHVKQELARLGKDYAKREIGIIAISSNDAQNYPDDAPENLKTMAKTLGLTFPFCYDETQHVAKTYTAACTPDFFLFSAGGGPASGGDVTWRLLYRGQLDDSRPGNGKPVTGKDLRAAIEAVLAGKPVSSTQKPSIGCNIKWKRGNEPDYAR
ncbi:MAG: thioredoxin family protein [Candidatus Omnitrophica bacterium]|nr:thioredoxin family protein [Candidatus Omnitrophota bacterium]